MTRPTALSEIAATIAPLRKIVLAPFVALLFAPAVVASPAPSHDSPAQAATEERYFGRIAQDFLRNPDRYTESESAAPSKDVANGLFDVRLSEPNEDLIEFGASVASAGDVNDDGWNDVIVGATNILFYPDGEGRAYVFFGGPNMDETADLILAGDVVSSGFGFSVAGGGDLNGDTYADLMVGAPFNGTGRVYIFYGGPGLDAVADLILYGEEPDARFGWSVDGAGDLNGDTHGDAIVGAPNHQSGAGRAYVYLGGPGVDGAADVILNGPSAGGFGWSVAGTGDVDGDDHPDVAVGAPLDEGSGRVFVYSGGPGMDATEDLILAGETDDFFGWSVAGTGDADGDGEGDLIVGAPAYDSQAGRAYVFYGGPSLDATEDLIVYGDGTYVGFGHSVDGMDLNGDMHSDLIVGSSPVFLTFPTPSRVEVFYGGPGLDDVSDLSLHGDHQDMAGYAVAGVEDLGGDGFGDVLAGGYANGYAYIFDGGSPMDSTIDSALMERPVSTGNDFGVSVAGVGDVNGDTWDDVLVGAPGYTRTGRAYLYFGGPDMDGEAGLFLQPTQPDVAGFGTSVAAAGDVNGDTWPDVVVGAPSSDPLFGSYAFIFYGGPDMDGTPDVQLLGSGTFGSSVAGAGDVNGDTYADVVVGQPESLVLYGLAWVYLGGPDMDTDADAVLGPEIMFDRFGTSVALGDVNGDEYSDVIVGSPDFNSATGRVYVYYGGSTLDETADVTLEGENVDDSFGFSVAAIENFDADLYGDMMVGAPGFDGDTGKVYVFRGGAPMESTAHLSLSGPVPGALFGYSLAGTPDLNGDSQADLLVGAPGFVSNTGRVLVYHGGSALDDVADSYLTGEQADDFLGLSVAGLGDVNADLGGDIIVGAPGHGDNGIADIFYGASPPVFAKTFTPDVTGVGVATTLVFTIDNSANSQAATSLTFQDPLPTGLVVAAAPNASTTCTGGSLDAVGAMISYDGGTVNAGESCILRIDVATTTSGTFENVSNPLASSLGSSGPATDTLRVYPPPGLAMTFEPSSILLGGVSTLILEFDNSGSTVAALDLAVTNDLPVEVVIADPAKASNDCGGTLTASPGGSTLSLTGGSLAAGATCSVSVDVTSDVLGSHRNATDAPSSTLGPSDPAEATLTVEDLAPPAVTAVTAADGDLDSCATVRASVHSIHLTIEDDRTSLLGAEEAGNYLLVSSGADGDFTTGGCTGVAGDDVAITLQANAVQHDVVESMGEGPVRTDVTLTFPGKPEGLPRGLYRLFVCDTVTDSAGNALDGDGDGVAGGDFEISSFRADPFNLLINGHFDDCPLTLDPWETSTTPPSVVETGDVKTDDVANSTLSASARIAQSALPSSQISQCVPVDGDESYRLEFRWRYGAPTGGIGILLAGCQFFDAASCAGSAIEEQVVGSLLEDAGGTWWLGERELLAPEAAVSARCGAETGPAGSNPLFDLYLDGIFFGPGNPQQIFQDGFESGDLSAWSAATP